MGLAQPGIPSPSPEEFCPPWNTLAPLWRGLPSLAPPAPLRRGLWLSSRVPVALPGSWIAGRARVEPNLPRPWRERRCAFRSAPWRAGPAVSSAEGETAPPRWPSRPLALRMRRRQAVTWLSSKMAVRGECSAGGRCPKTLPGIPQPGQLLSGHGSAGPAAPSGAFAVGGLYSSRVSGETEYGTRSAVSPGPSSLAQAGPRDPPGVESAP